MGLFSRLFLFLILVSCSSPVQEKAVVEVKTETIEENKTIDTTEFETINTVQTIKPSNSFDHIKHIRAQYKLRNSGGGQHIIDYIIKHLEKPEYEKYITDRSLLRKLKTERCKDDYILIQDTLLNGKSCKIVIKRQAFIPKNHKLKYDKNKTSLIEIDGKYPLGSVYAKHPDKELKSLEIKINRNHLSTNLDAYRNLFSINFCNHGYFDKAVEAYEDGNNIYIYIYGGQAADTYLAKLIFDETGYVTSFIADYWPLSQNASFGDHFIGF